MNSESRIKLSCVPKDTCTGDLMLTWNTMIEEGLKGLLEAKRCDHNKIVKLPEVVVNFK